MKVSEKNVRWIKKQESNSISRFSSLFVYLYRFRLIRVYVLRLCLKLERGVFFSKTLKIILKKYYSVTVGRYSYGPCNLPGYLPEGTIVGSYCSIANGLNVRRRNHPHETLSQHPFFFNHVRGVVDQDTVPTDLDNPLIIGNDVWIGSNVTILPNCTSIGNGAIIGAGAVVTKDVPPYAIFMGVPARKKSARYSDDVCMELEKLKWWRLPLLELLNAGDLLFEPVDLEALKSFSARLRR